MGKGRKELTSPNSRELEMMALQESCCAVKTEPSNEERKENNWGTCMAKRKPCRREGWLGSWVAMLVLDQLEEKGSRPWACVGAEMGSKLDP